MEKQHESYISNCHYEIIYRFIILLYITVINLVLFYFIYMQLMTMCLDCPWFIVKTCILYTPLSVFSRFCNYPVTYYHDDDCTLLMINSVSEPHLHFSELLYCSITALKGWMTTSWLSVPNHTLNTLPLSYLTSTWKWRTKWRARNEEEWAKKA